MKVLGPPALLVLLLSLSVSAAGDEKPSASKVVFRGGESLLEAVSELRKSGNDLADPPATGRTIKLTAGAHDFWPALDALCRQAHLDPRFRNERIELVESESKYAAQYIAYDGPFRAAIISRTITAYEHPGLGLDRLTIQVELACEPRMHPLLLKLPGNGTAWKWADSQQTSSARAGLVSYGFEGEKVRTFEVRLPRPERPVQQIDQLILQGTVWVSPRRLEFDVPLKTGAEAARQETVFRIHDVNDSPASRTWEVVTSLTYPPHSMEWESHQAALVGNLTMSLVNGNQVAASVGREVRTDESHRLEIRWLFKNVPGRPESWRARVITPAAPVAFPLKLEFKNVPLP